MYYAHRWAAEFIHGLETDGRDIIQQCDNPLCVQHLSSEPSGDTVERRRVWVAYSVGLEPPPDPPAANESAVPFYIEPDWLKQLRPEPSDDCF